MEINPKQNYLPLSGHGICKGLCSATAPSAGQRCELLQMHFDETQFYVKTEQTDVTVVLLETNAV